MRSVKVKKQELMTILHANKAKHVAEYAESVEDYKNAAVKLAAEHVSLASSGDLNQIAKIRAMPQTPVSYEDSYNRAIRMMELSVDDIIELEDQIFNQLVLDEWSWKNQFTATSALYKSF
jgi:hypothetical protein